jgi:hypothetical protein
MAVPGAALVTITGKDGQFFTSATTPEMEFAGDYAFVLGMSGGVVDNRGGKIRISKYQGKAVQIERPIKIEAGSAPH